MNTGGGAQAYLGRDGTLLYVAGARTDDRTLVWVDRNGTEELIDAPPGQYRSPRVSPDGDRILVQVTQGAGADIHVFDVARGLLSPVTSHPALDAFPMWTPAGDHIVFRSDRDLPGGVFRKASVGTGAEERIYFDPQRQVTPWSWSADGRTLLTSDFALVGPTGFEPYRDLRRLDSLNQATLACS